MQPHAKHFKPPEVQRHNWLGTIPPGRSRGRPTALELPPATPHPSRNVDSSSTSDLRRFGALLTSGWGCPFGSPNGSSGPPAS